MNAEENPISPMSLIEEEPMDDAMIFEDEDHNLFLQSKEGNERTLPKELYDTLSDLSDPYDPSKEFIGYVDPVRGVVIVDVSTLKEAHEKQKNEDVEVKSLSSVSTRSTDIEKYLSTHSGTQATEKNESENAQDNLLAETEEQGDETNPPHGSPAGPPASRPSSPSKPQKTLHQLAYEKKAGRFLPDDETRPISGFGIKQGKLLFNSTTFNAFNDEFHTDERTMGKLEEERLTALVERLNKEFEMNKRCKMCCVM